MLVYFFINIVIILMGICSWDGKKLKSLFWPCVILVCIASFRGPFTSDYEAYEQSFHRIDKYVSFSDIFSLTTNYSMEKGYVLLNKIIGLFTDSSVTYFLIISIITIFLVAKVIKKCSMIPWLSVFLFVTIGDYYASFNLTRQILAASICFMAYEAIKEKDLKKYLLIVLLASSIHTSSLIMIPMYYILQIKLSRKSLIVYGAVCGILNVFLSSILLFGQEMIDRYDGYTYGLEGGTINAIIPTIGITLFILFSWKFKKTTFDFQSYQNTIMINGVIWVLIFGILACNIYIFNRFMYFFKPYAIVLIANVLYEYKDYREKNIVIVAILILGSLFTHITLSGTGYEPYYFIFG